MANAHLLDQEGGTHRYVSLNSGWGSGNMHACDLPFALRALTKEGRSAPSLFGVDRVEDGPGDGGTTGGVVADLTLRHDQGLPIPRVVKGEAQPPNLSFDCVRCSLFRVGAWGLLGGSRDLAASYFIDL